MITNIRIETSDIEVGETDFEFYYEVYIEGNLHDQGTYTGLHSEEKQDLKRFKSELEAYKANQIVIDSIQL